MTTIAIKDGILAVDQIVICGNMIVSKTHDKVQRMPTGALAGVVGNVDMGQAFVRWLSEQGTEVDLSRAPCLSAKNDDGDSLESYVIVAYLVDGLTMVQKYSTLGMSEFYPVEAMAWGSGAQAARGAMAVGADAGEAVNAAAEVDAYTGEEAVIHHLEHLELDPAPVEKRSWLSRLTHKGRRYQSETMGGE